ncbi:hypothetical protein ZWY2020_016950 [Hordeum vulgare]|nr:hypothetical protein ZWY2020_016950 [Hordeum vulgare]
MKRELSTRVDTSVHTRRGCLPRAASQSQAHRHPPAATVRHLTARPNPPPPAAPPESDFSLISSHEHGSRRGRIRRHPHPGLLSPTPAAPAGRPPSPALRRRRRRSWPLLIVLSAAGVALSVPFAAYLASVAAANHLTGALLRSCQPPPPPPPYIQEYDDLEQEFLDAPEEYGQEAPAFGHLDTEAEQGTTGEEDGSDTSLPLSRDPEALADDEVEGQPLLQSHNWKEKEDGVYSKNNEEDDRTMEENRPAKETVLQGFYFPELGVPASGGDDDNVVQEKGEDELSVQNSGQQSFQFQSKNCEQAIIKEEKESDTAPLLPRDPGAEASAPVFADDEVEEEEVQGQFSAQESGHGSYMSYRGNDKEEHTPLEGSGSTQKETLPRGSAVSASAKPLFTEKDNVIQEEGNDKEAVQVSGEQSFRSKNWNETEEDVCSKKEEGDGKTMDENKSMEETVSQGLCFPESHVPASGEEDDNVVQEKGEGKFAAQHSGQRSFLSKNLNEEVEEEGKTTEENKTTKETAFYELPVPVSGDEDNVVQEKREGEISIQNSGQLPFKSKMWNEKIEDGKTTEENKSTEVTHSKGSYFPEWSVPASGDEYKMREGEFSVHNIGQYSLSSDIGDKKEHDITKEAKRLPTSRTVEGTALHDKNNNRYGAAAFFDTEGEMAGLYVLVGWSPCRLSDTSDRLMAPVQNSFLKSIIGVD